MGTANQGIEVALAGGFWGIFMLLWSIYERKKANAKLLFSVAHIFAWILMGLWFGLVTTFGWQAFRTPLVYLVVAAFVGAVTAGLIDRHRNRWKRQPGEI